MWIETEKCYMLGRNYKRKRNLFLNIKNIKILEKIEEWICQNQYSVLLVRHIACRSLTKKGEERIYDMQE